LVRTAGREFRGKHGHALITSEDGGRQSPHDRVSTRWSFPAAYAPDKMRMRHAHGRFSRRRDADGDGQGRVRGNLVMARKC